MRWQSKRQPVHLVDVNPAIAALRATDNNLTRLDSFTTAALAARDKAPSGLRYVGIAYDINLIAVCDKVGLLTRRASQVHSIIVRDCHLVGVSRDAILITFHCFHIFHRTWVMVTTPETTVTLSVVAVNNVCSPALMVRESPFASVIVASDNPAVAEYI